MLYCGLVGCKHNSNYQEYDDFPYTLYVNTPWGNSVKFEDLKIPYEIYPFTNLTKIDKIKIFITADIPYFFKNIWWKIRRKYE